jgi:hypothetical protein
LSALSLQDTTNCDSSIQLWYTLRRALLAMVRDSSFLRVVLILLNFFFKKRIALTSPTSPILKPRAV